MPIIIIYSSAPSASPPVMKHFVMNSFSFWRASDACAFFKTFLRLVPRFPGEENFLMFSLFLLIFSFLAFTRHAKRLVGDETKADLEKAGRTAKAWIVELYGRRRINRWNRIREILRLEIRLSAPFHTKAQ